MKKRITVLIIILSLTCLTLFLVACNKEGDSTPTPNETIVVDDAMYIKGNTLTGLTDNGKTLSTISVPKHVTNIGNNAFKECNNLNSVEFGDDSQLTSIEEGAFYGCKSLADIKLPSTLTNIGDNAFYYCSSLTSVTIPSSVTTIGKNAFLDCNNITTATIPTQAISFIPKSKLTTVVINGGTSIDSLAFNGCNSLTNLEIANSVTSIGDYAFCDCSSLTSIMIPSSVTSIDDWAFAGCRNLRSIMISDNSQLTRKSDV